MDRRDEVINEALAEEVQRGEQRKNRSEKATAAVPESEPAASAASKPREAPVEPDQNPKRRLLMKSASSTARTCRRWALVKAQRCLEHCQQTPGEELL